MKKYVYILSLALVLLFTIFIFQYFRFSDGKLHIIVCDVGQGDSILIRTPNGSDFLIDGGPDDKVLDCLASNMPFWDRTIEAVIMTHPDADHSTGLISVVERYHVISFNTQSVPGKTQTFRTIMGDLASKNLTARYLYQGDSFSETSQLVFHTLWPTRKAVSNIESDYSNKNLSLNVVCVTQLLEYKKFKGLFPCDEPSEVGDIVAPLAGKIDLLKVPHHGSKYGMDESYLAILKPNLAVISVGAKNRYGHPAPFSLGLLKKAGVKTLRTDLNGQIEIISDGNSFTYRTQR